jgi:DNA-binding PucR family transcriptional regulator
VQEKEYFEFAKENLERTNILTFEKVFPAFVAFNLPEYMKEKIKMELSSVFTEDPELYTTIKVFLENNLNASLTAKKLYIHRNTLQYRIDKFIDKTGVQLKDFYGAFTVLLACLLFEQRK